MDGAEFYRLASRALEELRYLERMRYDIEAELYRITRDVRHSHKAGNHIEALRVLSQAQSRLDRILEEMKKEAAGASDS